MNVDGLNSKKRVIAYIILAIVTLYIIAPEYFERNYYLNELISLIGALILSIKKFKIKNTRITALVSALLMISLMHAIVSVFKADSLYYYLRNMVIFYSMFSFFVGYFLFKYMVSFVKTFGSYISTYILALLAYPITLLFDRFGVSTILPITLRKTPSKFILPLMILLSVWYSISYESLTSLILSVFFLGLYIFPTYRTFMGIVAVGILVFLLTFIYLIPDLTINPDLFSIHNNHAIREVAASNPILGFDDNNTWRLIIWKQILIDLFPSNIIGIGFGTPAVRYFPVADYTKVDDLPYILGAHNSFVYLAGRLGLVTIFIFGLLYLHIIKEYFVHKKFYYTNSYVLIFLGFFAITIVAMFNTVLESPIYASVYWIMLGFLARVIMIRKDLIE